MATTYGATLTGGGSSVHFPVPGARPTVSGGASTGALFPGVLTALQAALTAASDMFETYSGGALPAVPSGEKGVLLDAVGGAVTVPSTYAAVVATGSAPVSVTENVAASLEVFAGGGPLTFTAVAGVGTVQSVAGDSLIDLSGVGYSVAAAGGANTVVAAGGNDNITFVDSGNLVFLGAGSHQVTGAGSDTIVGGTGNYNITGSGHSDIFLGSGNATVNVTVPAAPLYSYGLPAYGLPAPDAGLLIANGSGSTTISSQDGLGLLVTNGTGKVVVNLSSGNTSYYASATDSVFGGAGSVTVPSTSYPYNDLFVGGSAGGNVLYGDYYDTVVGGGSGDQLFAGNEGLAQAGAGAETLTGGYNATMLGGSGSDVFQSGSDDTIVAGTGATTVAAVSSVVQLGAGTAQATLSSSGDILFGGSGAATVSASYYGALVFGGSGPMQFTGGSGASTVVGGSGSETLFSGTGGGLYYGGSGGNNVLTGATSIGTSSVYGGGGTLSKSTLIGGGSGDVLTAKVTGDLLLAGPGNETLNGSGVAGGTDLFAGSGADCLIGGAGNDVFITGAGSATMVSGGGSDLFVFTAGAAGGNDLITGFNTAADFVTLQYYGTNAAATALAGAQVSGGNTTLSLSDGTKVTFAGVTNLTTANFV